MKVKGNKKTDCRRPKDQRDQRSFLLLTHIEQVILKVKDKILSRNNWPKMWIKHKIIGEK